jgi:tripartite-type tricarboxylate transporter receptor subunit TctC
MNRRDLVMAASAALTIPALLRAQELPQAPIRIVVGFPPGGGTDLMARLLSVKLGEIWKRSVIVENRAGAAGTIASEYVAGQPGDGSVLMMTTISNHAIAPSIYPQLRYDPERDFAPIALVGVTPLMLVARPGLGVKSLKEVIDRCKASPPGTFTFGSSGAGSAQHLALELFKLRAGVTATHVPYRGSGPLLTDLAAGHIDYSFETMTSVAPFVPGGRVTPIAQTRLKRAASFPSVPTMSEAGLAGYEASTWYGLVAPSKMNPTLVSRINANVNELLKVAEIREKLQGYGAEDGGGTSAAFGEFIRQERAKWAMVIREGKVQV